MRILFVLLLGLCMNSMFLIYSLSPSPFTLLITHIKSQLGVRACRAEDPVLRPLAGAFLLYFGIGNSLGHSTLSPGSAGGQLCTRGHLGRGSLHWWVHHWQDQLTPVRTRWQKANAGTSLTEIKAIWQHLNPILLYQYVLDTPSHQ